MPVRPSPRHALVPPAAALAALAALAFWPVLGNGFVSLDDPAYLTDNPTVRRGLSLAGLRWAFTTFHAANWHPLTWVSHMLDVQLFGLDPRGHHLAGLALHAAATLLLFVFLARAAGRPLPAFFAAALFGVHPLRVESVAWAAERKDVLAALFWMLALLAHLRHAARPSAARLLGVLAAFCAGLMAKPSLLTLPAVLLVLDWWPLGRARRIPGRPRPWGRLLAEKLPLLPPVLVSLALTLAAQSAGETIRPLPWEARLANLPVNHLSYAGMILWPDRLYLPHLHAPSRLTDAPALAGLALLAGLTLGAWRLRRGSPFLLSGWLWYLAASAPTIGLVQLVNQSVADRYTYLPSAGLALAAVWAVSRLGETRLPPLLPPLAGGAIIVALTLATRGQVRHWKDDLSLFGHTAEADPGNVAALLNTATALHNAGRHAEALERYRALLENDPAFVQAWFFLGNTLAALGRDSEAIAAWERALELAPLHVEARIALGEALVRAGRPAAAAAHLETALGLRPGDVRALAALQAARAAPPPPR